MDIRTIESAWLLAQTRFDAWQREFETKLFAPAAKTDAIRMANDLMSAPAEIKQTVAQAKPQQWADVERIAKGQV